MLKSKKVVFVLLALTIAATGSAFASSGASGARPIATAAAACGTVPQKAPADRSGLLKKFPPAVQGAYNLYPGKILASAWAKWKPKHKAPYKIYFSPGNTFTPFIQTMVATLNQLKAKSGGKISQLVIQDSNNNVQTQIQQIQQAIRAKYDAMIILPLSPAGDLQVMAAAAKAGIPVITPLNSSTSKYVVGVQGNAVLEGAKLGQALASALGRKGTLLDVHGIPGVQVDTDEFAGANQVLKNCPQIKTVGSVVGGFVPSVAKTQTLQFLASHPAAVDSVFQAAGMATGIIQAFQQTGRKVPTIVDVGGTPGALAYWNQHKGSYHGVALGLPPAQLSTASWNVMMGLLAGRGLKVNQIEQQPLMITNRNLAQWLQPGWTLDTPLAYAPGPKNALLPPSYLNQFFGK